MNKVWREWNPVWGMRWNSWRNGVYWFVRYRNVENAWGVLDGAVHTFDYNDETRFGRLCQKICDYYDALVIKGAG
jgi:hypothetical protein